MGEYLARLVGGPLDDVTLQMTGTWPLPDRLTAEHLVHDGAPLGEWAGHAYEKVRESQLPAEVDAQPGLMRGAEYRWAADA